MKRTLVSSLAVVVCVCAIAASAAKSAREGYTRLRQDATKAYKAKDYNAARQAFLESRKISPNSPGTVYNLACVSSLAGDTKAALQWLELYARMGQVADAEKDPDLAAVVKLPEYKSVAERMKSNLGVVESPAFMTIPGKDLLLEDIAYDPDLKQFFLTSLLGKKVLRIDSKELVSDVADLSNLGFPVFAVAFQGGKRPVLWVAAAAMPNFAASPRQDWGKSTLLKVDAKTGEVLDSIAPPDDGRPHVLGDIAIDTDGKIVVSDGRSGAVYLLAPGDTHLRRIDSDEFISPQTPAFTPDHKHVLVADYARGIGKIELKSGRVTWLTAPEDIALTGIDGLYLQNGSLIAVQNGTNPVRIVRLKLNAGIARIEGVEVLAANGATKDINHGVLVGSSFHYLTNAGWDALDGEGNRKPGTAPQPVIRVVQLSH